MSKKGVSLSVGRGEKQSVSEGAGLTAKGRAKYNRETGSKLKAPAPNPKTKKDEGRKKSFCARMRGVVAKAKGPATRARASLKKVELSMSKPGLYANIAAKKDRIKAGSGEKMRKVGSKGAPTAKDFKESAKTAKKK
jgi:hypothetical protein